MRRVYGFLEIRQVRMAEDGFEDIDQIRGEVALEEVESPAELGDEVCEVFARDVVVLLFEYLFHESLSFLLDLRLDECVDF